MKKLMQSVILITAGLLLVGGTLVGGKVNSLKHAAQQLDYSVSDFQLHKVDLESQVIEVDLRAKFDNVTNTDIKVNRLQLNIYVPDQSGKWRRLIQSKPTSAFTVRPGITKQPIRFVAPMAREFTTIIPNLFQGKSQPVLVEAIVSVHGINLPPETIETEFNLEKSVAQALKSKLGLGLTATDKKAKPLPAHFNKHLRNLDVKGQSITVVADGNNFRTLREMEKVVKETLHQTEDLAKELRRDNLTDTLKSVFNFANDYFAYRIDEPGYEQIRTPGRAIKDRHKGIDCDCFSVLLSSILTNLNIKHKYRMASYDPSVGYQHVYVIVPKNQSWS